MLVGLALLGLVAWLCAMAGIVPTPIARALGAGAAQGSLLACAVAWTAARPAPMGDVFPIGIALMCFIVGAISLPAADVAKARTLGRELVTELATDP